MTDQPGFLAAILDSPDDDTPRLVYADWLEENGQEARAEFIRVQCELARLEGYECKCGGLFACAGCARFIHRGGNSLRRRERELLADPAVTPAQPHVSAVTWRRGFVESITCTAADWHRHGKAILAAQPVREVRLHAIDLEERVGIDCVVEGAELRIARYENQYIYTHADGNVSVYAKAVITGPPPPNPGH